MDHDNDRLLHEQLHARLVEAASAAPNFRGLRRPRKRSGRRLLVGFLSAGVVTSVLASLWIVVRPSPTTDDGGDDASSCAATITFRDSKYRAHGGQIKKPRPGPNLGVGTVPPCEGVTGDTVDVYAFPGVEPSIAVIVEGSVWIQDATSGASLPGPIVDLESPVECLQDGTTTVRGTWTAYEGPTEPDGTPFTPPYVAVVEASAGAGLPLDRYTSVTIEIRVTSSTSGATDRELARHALYDGAPVQFDVRCDRGQFSATSIRPGADPQ